MRHCNSSRARIPLSARPLAVLVVLVFALALALTLALASPTLGARSEGSAGSAVDAASRTQQLGSELLYSTHLGGGYTDGAYSVAVSGGLVYIAGRADNADATAHPFPLTIGAYDTSPNGPEGYTDAFVAVLAPGGNGSADLLYSTLLGGSAYDVAMDVAVAGGHVYVTGMTNSLDFPTTLGAFDTTKDGSNNAFVAVFDATLSTLEYSTLLKGASGEDKGSCIEAENGRVHVAGYTQSDTFPTTAGAYSTTLGGGFDVFLATLEPSGAGASDLVYSTFLGGTSKEDVRYGCLVTRGGKLYLAGTTYSADFPVKSGDFDVSHAGRADVFVSILDPAGNGSADLLHSTLLGGSDDDFAKGLAVSTTAIYVAGTTDWEKNRPMAELFPTTVGAFDRLLGDGWMPLDLDTSDAFLSVLDPSLSTLVYSTFLGGSGPDGAEAVAVLDGKAYLTGSTYADATVDVLFPTTAGAFDTSYNGVTDSFLTILEPSGGGASDLLYSTLLGGSSFETGFDLVLSAGKVFIAGTTESVTVPFPTTVGAFDESANGFTEATLTVLPNLTLLFADGFESGDLSAWSGN